MPTIAAIATAPGAGGIGIVRLSGPQAREILSRMFRPASVKFTGFRPWVLHRGRVLDHEGVPLDDVLAVFMPGPRTFTGEDVAEIHCHGGPFIVQAVLETALRLGARAAERGEFSRRAFVNGRMDLSQAEAVAELIAAPSREALRYSLNRLDGLLGRKVTALRRQLEGLRVQMSLAVDFPDEEVECLAPEAFAAVVEEVAAAVRGLLTGQRRAQVMQQGAVVVLAGAVNAGKSSLLNALLGRNRALVTDIPGTTRDFLEEGCQLDGLPVRLTDTAGLRETGESVEEMGVALSRQKVRQADAILLLVDGGRLGPAGAAPCCWSGTRWTWPSPPCGPLSGPLTGPVCASAPAPATTWIPWPAVCGPCCWTTAATRRPPTGWPPTRASRWRWNAPCTSWRPCWPISPPAVPMTAAPSAWTPPRPCWARSPAWTARKRS